MENDQLKEDLLHIRWMMEHYCQLSLDGQHRARAVFIEMWKTVHHLKPPPELAPDPGWDDHIEIKDSRR